MDGNVLLTNIMFAHRLIGCYNTRLTIIYLAENYQNLVRNLCKSLKQKINEENLEEIEKSKHVKQFIIDFTQLTNNFEDTRLIQSVKQIRYLTPWISEIVISLTDLFIRDIFMELAATDLDDLKQVLAVQLVTCKDENLCVAIKNALQYIEASSLTNTVWNGFPTNVNLIFSFLNVLINYVIATLQILY
ncbi:hypothetical protein SFRURICE_011077 [Spodoptera frugiperda]|nr:hypothetical protein SFRURICE_011077 [Spodoptera frugiperda]